MKKFLLAACSILTVLLVIPRANAQTYRTLYSFASGYGPDGANPYASLVFDSAGNLYGETDEGGLYGQGTVFKLSPVTGGGWIETVLYSFGRNRGDGQNPSGAGLVLDASGNIYGTTAYGGAGTCHCGTVYELVAAGGVYTEKILHSFTTTGEDGQFPQAGLVLDGLGNLFGTTWNGGIATCTRNNNVETCGTVYELLPQTNGTWKEKVIHRFTDNGKDGFYPTSKLVFDAAGNLYGTTGAGGRFGTAVYAGTVFKLTPTVSDGWAETVLHNFGQGQTGSPYAGVVFDPAGNLYGATYVGGTANLGTVFKLTPATGGQWTESVLYSFLGGSTDGCQPFGGVTLDSAGNVYGADYQCGANNSGTVFELSPATGGGWTETTLYNFARTGMGWQPYAGVILDASGNIYGTTTEGGPGLNGTVYEITP